MHATVVPRQGGHEVLVVADRLGLEAFAVPRLGRVYGVPLALRRVVLAVTLIRAVAADQARLEDVLPVDRRVRDGDSPVPLLGGLALRTSQVILHRLLLVSIDTTSVLGAHVLRCNDVWLAQASHQLVVWLWVLTADGVVEMLLLSVLLVQLRDVQVHLVVGCLLLVLHLDVLCLLLLCR